jgi:hypothetical protein
MPVKLVLAQAGSGHPGQPEITLLDTCIRECVVISKTKHFLFLSFRARPGIQRNYMILAAWMPDQVRHDTRNNHFFLYHLDG